MEVYKFGGASVKDAEAVRNVADILNTQVKGPVCVVISAMGKTTNALEAVLDAFYHRQDNQDALFKDLMAKHIAILRDLFPDNAHAVYGKVKNLFGELYGKLSGIADMAYDRAYDQVVSYGERLSTCIVSSYLSEVGIYNRELDATKLLLTDGRFREGKVVWEETGNRIRRAVAEVMDEQTQIVITQGFIACDTQGNTVTLGREGSDYSAAVFAYCLDAERITIWKDVPGVLNADPKYFSHTEKLDYISYYDATELAYYGASIIHPKTIKPLQNKHIPLHVRSFVDVDAPGTWVGLDNVPNSKVPSYIFKNNQVLLSIYPKDFSFVDEHNLSEIFGCFVKYGLKVNMMQNSALSFSVCIDGNKGDLQSVIEALSQQYDCRYNGDLKLVTIRHYTQEVIDRLVGDIQVMLEQRSRQAVQLVLKP
ncbi:MAG: aspartate kinase [Bacteroides sp.]|nr:aspartate kinase [Bacteroides sp.]